MLPGGNEAQQDGAAGRWDGGSSLSGTSQALDKGMHVAPAPKPQTQSFWDFVLTLAGQNHWELGG